MTVYAMFTCTVFREPQRRNSAAGRPYVTLTVKTSAADNSNAEFWSVLAFGDSAQEELMRLGVNEKLALQGTMKIETYVKDGETKIGRTLFCDHVLALRAPPKEKKPKPSPAGSKGADTSVKQSILPPSDLDDEIPF